MGEILWCMKRLHKQNCPQQRGQFIYCSVFYKLCLLMVVLYMQYHCSAIAGNSYQRGG